MVISVGRGVDVRVIFYLDVALEEDIKVYIAMWFMKCFWFHVSLVLGEDYQARFFKFKLVNAVVVRVVQIAISIVIKEINAIN